MKRIFSIILFLMANQLMQAQHSWTIKMNNKVLLTANKEDTVVNKIVIKNSDWQKKWNLEVDCKETEASPAMKHSILFTDEKEERSITKDSTLNCKIPLSTLRKKFAGKKHIKIFMVTGPANPMMMFPTRRTHLCTLLIK